MKKNNLNGQMIIEYVIMFTVLVAIIALASMTLIRPSVNKLFGDTATAINKIGDDFLDSIK